MSGKKNRKGKPKTKVVLSLGEFLGSDSTVASTIVSAPRHDDDDDYPQAPVSLVLPTCPRMARGPHVDIEKINPAGPFICHVANLPFEADESDIRKFFDPLRVKNMKLPMDREGARSKGFGYVEFESKSDLIDALQKHEEMLRSRKIRIDLPDGDGTGAMGDRSSRDGGYRREGGSRWGDREGRSDDRGERSQGVSDWRSAPPSQADGEERGGFGRGDRGFAERERGGRFGGGGSRYDDDRRAPSRADDEPWRRSGPPSSSGGFEDRDRRGGSGYGDRRGGGFEDRRGGGGGGFEDRRGGGGGFGDRRGRDSEDRFGGYSRSDDREPPRERQKLMLKPRSVPSSEAAEGKAPDSSQAEQAPSAASIFGAAKPVNTASKESEIENRLTHKSPSIPKRDVPKVSNADIFGAARPVDTASKELAIEEKLSGRRSPNTTKKEAAPKPAAADIFGAARPVDTLARELEIEKKLSSQPIAEGGRSDTWRGSRDGDRRGGRNDGARGYDRDGGRVGDREHQRSYDDGGRDNRDRDNRYYEGDSRGYAYDRDGQYSSREDRSSYRNGRSSDVDRHSDPAESADQSNGRMDVGRQDRYSDEPNGVDKVSTQEPVERPEDYDSDEERFLKAQPKSNQPEVLSVMNKFSTLDFEEEEDMP